MQQFKETLSLLEMVDLLVLPTCRDSDDESASLCRKQEILLYIAPLVLYDTFYPRRFLPVDPPTFFSICLDVLLSLFVYDLLFTIVHFICHKVRIAPDYFPRACFRD
jgi:hypothetical protein